MTLKWFAKASTLFIFAEDIKCIDLKHGNIQDILQNDLPVISKNVKVKKAKERQLLYSWSGMIPHAAGQLSPRATTDEPAITEKHRL